MSCQLFKKDYFMKKSITRSAALLIFSSCVGLFQLLQLANVAKGVTGSMGKTEPVTTQKYKDSLALTSRLPTFGFDNARANFTFLSFLQYFGDDPMRKESGYGLSPNFFEAIIADNPYYKEFYVFLTNSVSLNAAQPEKTVALINEGLLSLSPDKSEDSFYIWRYKGVEELLFLGDSQAAKRSFEIASVWARESSLPESDTIAAISQQTADFLEQNPDSKAAQIGAWSSILTTAFDDETRSRAISSIQALGGEVVISENGEVTVKYPQEIRAAEG
jgi:hypothetical protein